MIRRISALAALTAAIAVVLALTPALRHRASAQTPVTLPDQPRGDGSGTLLPNGWQVTPAGHEIALPGDLPLRIIVTPGGKSLIVNTGGYHDHSVSLIDIASGALTQSVNVGKDWAGMCLDGSDIYVSGGGAPSSKFLAGAAKQGASPALLESFQHPVLHLTLADGTLTQQPSIDIAGLNPKDRYIAGLTAGPGGVLYVVNTENDTIYRLQRMPAGPPQLAGSAKVGYGPYAAALSPDGRTLAVSNWGDKSVSLLDPITLQEQQRIKVGSLPNDLVWSKDGRLFVANSGSNSVSVISGGRVRETIKTSLDPKAPVGSTPDALALAPDGARLYVANADNNDVAVIDLSNAKESKVLGFIPTAWYPSALAVSPDGRQLFIGTGKGLRFRANARPDTHVTSPQTLSGYDYIGNVLSGDVAIVDVPDAAQLADYTRQVQANIPSPPNPLRDLAAKDVTENALKKIKHVVYIIRENRTYDEVFGDIKAGNGDPDLTLFGANVTPNGHALAGDFVLLDNLYCNGEVSEDGHQWCDSAYATDFKEKAWTNSYSGRGEPNKDGRLNASPAGYLWTNCARHGVSYYSYGEFASYRATPDAPPIFTGSQGLNGHSSAAYGSFGWFAEPRDVGRAEIFIDDMRTAEKTGKWPQFMVMSLPEDHTQGTSPGSYTPTANVAENDQALGRIVQAVSHSKFWPDTAIFVIEDDAQNGPDHVDAHRTEGLVISPYIKRHFVDSTMYSTASYVHTMELILGLPPMTQFDAQATPLYHAFTTTPDLTPYDPRPAQVDVEAKNTKKTPGAQASLKLDFSAPDRADPDKLNAILWEDLKPGVPLPAPVRSARLPR